MKGNFDFSEVIDRGPGTNAVDAILRLWADIDWFEALESVVDPKAMFAEHVDIARALDPAYYPEPIEFEVIEGTREDFGFLCGLLTKNAWQAEVASGDQIETPGDATYAQTGMRQLLSGPVDRVEKTPRRAAWRAQFSVKREWNWRYGVLKKLRSTEQQRSGWRPEVADPAHPKPGTLFFRLPHGKMTIWLDHRPSLDFRSWSVPARQSALWYLTYANIDMLHAAAWQLSRGSDELPGNPFLPILRLYEVGAFPFVFSPSLVVLFRFSS